MSALGDRLAAVALNYQGYPYRFAGTSPAGFDCSGFVRFIVEQVMGETISGDSHAQMHIGTSVPRTALERGDILGYDTMEGREVREGNAVSHVGIYVGNGKMMNCMSEALGCRVSDLSTAYWNGNGATFVDARRLTDNPTDIPTESPPEREPHDKHRNRVPRTRGHNTGRIRKRISSSQLSASSLRERLASNAQTAYRIGRGTTRN